MWRKEEEQVEERGRTGGGKRTNRWRKEEEQIEERERESVCVRACVRACVRRHPIKPMFVFITCTDALSIYH